MEKRDNYAIAAAQARTLFLQYDQLALARKLRAKTDADYFYTSMLSQPYRIHRRTGDISRFYQGEWQTANSFAETLTLLDLVCDSSADRCPTGRWKNTRDFGLQFHRNLLEMQHDPWADRFEREPQAFAKACEALDGEKYPLGDVAYSIEVFDGLRVLIQLWFGDEEFPAQLRWLWDENALMYIKYETMYYAIGLIESRLEEQMNLEREVQ